RGIENSPLGIVLAQTVVVKSHSGLDRQANKPHIRLGRLVYITRGLERMPHATPSVDFVAEEERQLEVVVRGRPAIGVAVVRPVLRFASSGKACTNTERGRQE